MDTAALGLLEAYPVTANHIAQYRRDGHILLHGVVPPDEIGHYRTLLEGVTGQGATTRQSLSSPKVATPRYRQIANVWRSNEEVREFVFARRFARIAAELMGVHGVRLYHDELLIKEPGGVATPWHKDHYSWPLATHNTIKLWLALVDIRLEMGVIRYATGTHRAGQFPEVPPSYESDEMFKRIIHDHNIPVVSYAMKAGDASLHSGALLHSAPANDGTEPRKVLAIIYFEDGTTIMEPNHEHRRRDLEEFSPGLRAGDLAAGDLHPLLYSDDASRDGGNRPVIPSPP